MVPEQDLKSKKSIKFNKIENDINQSYVTFKIYLDNLISNGIKVQIPLSGGGYDKNYFINEEYNIQTQSTYADNLDLDAQAGFNTEDTSDDILDFTERNPFGEVDF